MSKYEALRIFLQGQGAERIPMTFAEIERVIGFRLPKSQAYPAWWSNNPTNNVMTREWLAAGYKTEQVDIEGHKLVFRRTDPPATRPFGFAEERHAMDDTAGEPRKRRRHPAFGALKDVTWIAPGTDLTAPAYPEWADMIDDPKWHP